MRILLSFVLFLMITCVQAQNAWRADDIDDNLKRDAHSVVRTYELQVNAPSPKALTQHHHLVLTVLSKKGNSHAAWSCLTSKFEKLSSFSCKVYNAQGKLVSKRKMSDVHTAQYSEHLATDSKNNYVEPPVMDYPYTVEYEWEIKCTDGYMEYGFFSPIDYDRQALQHAEYVLTVPSGTQIRHLSLNEECEPKKDVVGKNDVYTWTLAARGATIDDIFEDDALYVVPSVIAIPREFTLGESNGTLDSWEQLGRWYAQLAEGRGTLLPADIDKVRQLTANCSNEREKTEALYDYLGEKTRYVSIQLGLGGWQPMSAEEVGKTGFGDCKALTNYMQSLLREAGIESYQTIISTEYANLLNGFPNMHQTDHVILTIPQKDGGNLVIECTNPQLPLGFVPGTYAGHEALLVDGDASRIIRIDGYTPENSYETLKAEVKLNVDGTSTVAFDCDHFGARYGNVRTLAQKQEKDRKEIVAKWISLKVPIVHEATAVEERDSMPHLIVHSTMGVTYGEKHGEKIFVKSNPFRKFSVPRFRKGRRHAIVVESAYTLTDEIRIEIPEGFICTSEVANERTTTNFGSYTFEVKKDGKFLCIKTSVAIRNGKFDISEKDAFVTFREGISKMMDRTLIFEKQ